MLNYFSNIYYFRNQSTPFLITITKLQQLIQLKIQYQFAK